MEQKNYLQLTLTEFLHQVTIEEHKTIKDIAIANQEKKENEFAEYVKFGRIEMYKYIEFISDTFLAEKIHLILDDIDDYFYYMTTNVHVKQALSIRAGRETSDINISEECEQIILLRESVENKYNFFRTLLIRKLAEKNEAIDNKYILLELQKYIDNFDLKTVEYAIHEKKPYNNNKLEWVGEMQEAYILSEVFSLTLPQMNKCFSFKGGKNKLAHNNKPLKNYKDSEFYKIISLYKMEIDSELTD